MLSDHLRISLKNIREKGLRSWLTLIGIFIGITAVVALIGLGGGMRTAITSQFGANTADVISVQASASTSTGGPPGSNVVTPLTRSDAQAIERISGVEAALPRLVETIAVEYNDVLSVTFATSVNEGDDREIVEEVLNIEIEQGRFLKDGDNYKAVVGHNLGEPDNEYEKAMVIGSKITINDQEFEVIGITKKQGSFIFDNVFYINDGILQDLADKQEEVDVIGVKVKDKSFIEPVKEDIERLLRKRRDVRAGEEDFSVQTPDAILESLDSILAGIQMFIVIIASISIIVGGIGIVNTMVTAVLERRRQIGIMKSIGARNSDIFMIFFIESGLMGLIGGGIGAIIGTLISYFGTVGINAWVGSSSSPEISIPLILGALAGSFLVGAIAGVAPALRAARQNPVDALRG